MNDGAWLPLEVRHDALGRRCAWWHPLSVGTVPSIPKARATSAASSIRAALADLHATSGECHDALVRVARERSRETQRLRMLAGMAAVLATAMAFAEPLASAVTSIIAALITQYAASRADPERTALLFEAARSHQRHCMRATAAIAMLDSGGSVDNARADYGELATAMEATIAATGEYDDSNPKSQLRATTTAALPSGTAASMPLLAGPKPEKKDGDANGNT